jgi:hypothetical protein
MSFSSRKPFVILMLALVILSLIVTVTIQAQTMPNPSASPNASPSPSVSPNLQNGQTFYGPVISMAQDKTSFNIQSNFGNQSQVSVKVGPNTAYYGLATSPFNLSTTVNIFYQMIGKKASGSSFPGTSGMSMSEMSEMSVPSNALSQFFWQGSFDDLSQGDLVIAMINANDNFGRQIFILKFPENIRFAQGIISAFSDNAIVITPPSPALGPAVSLGWDTSSRFILEGSSAVKVGSSISVIYDGSSNMLEMGIVGVPPTTPAVSPLPSATPAPTPVLSPPSIANPGSNAVEIYLSIQNSRFNPAFITVPRSSQVTVQFANQDQGKEHNFSIYNNRNATTIIFKGNPIVGPSSAVYQFIAPDINATYFFRCDIHPQENGQLMVGGMGE